MMKPFPFGRAGLLAVAALALLSVSCASELTRTGRSPAFLVIDKLEGASGAKSTEFAINLLSDVITMVDQQVNGQTVKVPTIFNDLGRATMHLAMKNPGTTDLLSAPSTINAITLNRYHVSFKRSDGRNTPGVDVPYGFDGGLTVTFSGTEAASFGFELIRHAMKEEPPLKNLRDHGGAGFISTIAEITFYGRDQAGNEVSAAGSMLVDFGDFGDPK
jgi:hypothetical protein